MCNKPCALCTNKNVKVPFLLPVVCKALTFAQTFQYDSCGLGLLTWLTAGDIMAVKNTYRSSVDNFVVKFVSRSVYDCKSQSLYDIAKNAVIFRKMLCASTKHYRAPLISHYASATGSRSS